VVVAFLFYYFLFEMKDFEAFVFSGYFAVVVVEQKGRPWAHLSCHFAIPFGGPSCHWQEQGRYCKV
jgi:hypothetical protein